MTESCDISSLALDGDGLHVCHTCGAHWDASRGETSPCALESSGSTWGAVFGAVLVGLAAAALTAAVALSPLGAAMVAAALRGWAP